MAEIGIKKIFPKDFFKNISCNNEGVKKMKEKIFKNINQKDFEVLKNAAHEYFKNISYTVMKQDIIDGTYYFMKMIDEGAKDALIGPSNTEKNIFDEFNDIALKTNEKILKDFMRDKFDRLKNKKTSKKDDIINGLRSLDSKKKKMIIYWVIL